MARVRFRLMFGARQKKRYSRGARDLYHLHRAIRWKPRKKAQAIGSLCLASKVRVRVILGLGLS